MFLTEIAPQLDARPGRRGDRTARRHSVDHLRHVGPVRPGAGAGRARVSVGRCAHGHSGRSSARLFAGPPLGLGMLTAGLVLAIMVIPFIASVMREVFLTVPGRLKESAYALGSTRWEVVWDVVLPYTRSAVIGGIFLGLGRALGETMAVTFVLGNAHELTASLLMPGNSIAATIANEFSEADSEMYRSSLIALGFVLFLVTFVVLAVARLMLRQLDKREGQLMAALALYGCRDASRTCVAQAARDRSRRSSACSGWRGSCGPRCTTGLASLNLALFTQMTPPPGDDRRPAQRVLRQRRDERARHRCSARRSASSPARTWPNTRDTTVARRNRPLRQRHPAVGAVDRARPVRLHARRGADGAFLRAGRCDRAGLHRAAGGRAHHRRNAAPGAGADARSRAVAGRAAMEGHRAGALSRRRCRASSPASCWRWRASAAKPRRCCSPRSTTSTGRPTCSPPMANVPVVIFQYAMSPYDGWHSAGLGRRVRAHRCSCCSSAWRRARSLLAQPDHAMTDLLPGITGHERRPPRLVANSATLRAAGACRRSSSPRAGSTSSTASRTRSRDINLDIPRSASPR